jgi:hypothetical protein
VTREQAGDARKSTTIDAGARKAVVPRSRSTAGTPFGDRQSIRFRRAATFLANNAYGSEVSVEPMVTKRKLDFDEASRSEAAPGVGKDADLARLPHLESAGTRPVHRPRPGGWSVDAIFYLVAYAAITAAVLSFFGIW